MSLVQTLGKREAEIEALQKELAAEKEKVAAREKALADAGAAQAAAEARVKELVAEKEATEKRVMESHNAALTEIEGLKAQVAEAEKGRKAIEDELGRAKAALKNPAFVDAAAPGQDPAKVPDGGVGAEQPAGAAASKTPHCDEYLRLRAAGDWVACTAYWNAHEAEMRAEMKATAGVKEAKPEESKGQNA